MSPVVAGGVAYLEAGAQNIHEVRLHRSFNTSGDAHLFRQGGGVLGADGVGVGALGGNCPQGVVTRQHNLYHHSKVFRNASIL